MCWVSIFGQLERSMGSDRSTTTCGPSLSLSSLSASDYDLHRRIGLAWILFSVSFLQVRRCMCDLIPAILATIFWQLLCYGFSVYDSLAFVAWCQLALCKLMRQLPYIQMKLSHCSISLPGVFLGHFARPHPAHNGQPCEPHPDPVKWAFA